MKLDYKKKVINALEFAKTVDDVNYIKSKIQSTKYINRRTKEGRELTDELLDLCMGKITYLYENGAIPF